MQPKPEGVDVSNRSDEVLDIIFQALRALNEERSEGEKIEVGPTTCLFGEHSVLDSLSLVSVIVDLETLASDHFGVAICLTDDRAMGSSPVPFTNVTTLQAYILELIG
jgi:acyl carrier protein